MPNMVRGLAHGDPSSGAWPCRGGVSCVLVMRSRADTNRLLHIIAAGPDPSHGLTVVAAPSQALTLARSQV